MKLIPLASAILAGSLALSAPATFAKAVSQPAPQRAKAAQQVSEAVNLNTADVTALSSLKGIGQKRAEAIVAYRKQHGKFKTVNDLTQIRGIGQRFVDKNKAKLRV